MVFFDSLGGKRDKDGLKGTVGDTNDDVVCSVRFFLNLCASYIHAINSPDQRGTKYKYQDHFFGNCQKTKGTKQFPRFDFETPSILSQDDGWNCGLATVANALAFVHHFEEADFVLSDFKCVSEDPEDMHYVVDLDPSKIKLSLFWKKLEKKAKPKYKKKGFNLKKILPTLQQEFFVVSQQFSEMFLDETKDKEVIEIDDTDTESECEIMIQFPKDLIPENRMDIEQGEHKQLEFPEQKKKAVDKKLEFLNKQLEKKPILDRVRKKLEWQKSTLDALEAHMFKETMTNEEYIAFRDSLHLRYGKFV